MLPRKDEEAFRVIYSLLNADTGMGFNELLRALQQRRAVMSAVTLARYLRMLERQGLVERRVVRDKPPRLVEYRRGSGLKRSEQSFTKLQEEVKTSESVTVVLTDVKTGEKRVLTLDKEGKWVPT